MPTLLKTYPLLPLLFPLFLFSPVPTSSITPVVLIPGVVSSRLQANLTNATSPNLPFYCQVNSEWYTIWVNSGEISRAECFLPRLMTHINASTGCSESAKGVKIKPIDFGLPSCCDILNPGTIFPELQIFYPL
jgi:hypothetical protein